MPLIVVDGEIGSEHVQRVVRMGVQQHLPSRCASCPRATALASTLRWAMARHARGRELEQAAGDDVLRLVAQRLIRVLRESDTVARLGGDEFVVILDGIRGRADARAIARTVERALEQPCVVAGRSIVPRASVGIAVHPEDGRDAAALERSADAAMYALKRAHARAAGASGSLALSRAAGIEAPSTAGPSALRSSKRIPAGRGRS